MSKILTLAISSGVARGDIWLVRFEPSEGDEIRKTRPAVVIGVQNAGRMKLQIVVPITGWQPQFERYFWMVQLEPSPSNGLTKESAADVFQIKSVSVNRFQERVGAIEAGELRKIAAAIAICVGFQS